VHKTFNAAAAAAAAAIPLPQASPFERCGGGRSGGRMVEQSTRRDLHLGWLVRRRGRSGDGSSLGGWSRVIRKNYVH